MLHAACMFCLACCMLCVVFKLHVARCMLRVGVMQLQLKLKCTRAREYDGLMLCRHHTGFYPSPMVHA